MEIPIDSWSEYRDLLIRKNPNWQHKERDGYYRLFFTDGGDTYIFDMTKTDPASDDQAEWENVYMSRSNYAVGQRAYAFSTGDFEFNGDGVSFTARAGQATSVDFKILSPGSKGLYINGGDFYTANSKVGDWIEVAVVDTDGVLVPPGIPGLLLKSWVRKWYVSPSGSQSIRTPYAGLIPGGFYLRVTYHSVGETPVDVALNLMLHLGI